MHGGDEALIPLDPLSTTQPRAYPWACEVCGNPAPSFPRGPTRHVPPGLPLKPMLGPTGARFLHGTHQPRTKEITTRCLLPTLPDPALPWSLGVPQAGPPVQRLRQQSQAGPTFAHPL